MKKIVLSVLVLLTLSVGYSQNQNYYSLKSHEFIAGFLNLSAQQIIDTGNYYFLKNSYDTALICYTLFATAAKNNDYEQQKKVVEAYNKSAIIYYYLCDYKNSYDFLIKALLRCEELNYDSYLSKIYTNIGNIYYRFHNHDLAKFYYSKALNFPQDSASVVVLLNNIGAVELDLMNLDSAAHFLNKALQISKQNDNFLLHGIENNIASYYQKMQHYDSALYYYHSALKLTKESRQIEKEAENLSDIGILFFEINKPDSALFYIGLSNRIAKEHSFIRILADNYLVLSKIEETKGNAGKSLEHFKQYNNLKDSIFKLEYLGGINQLQYSYERSKTNHQIEQLTIEQQIKERTIHYQRVIQFITFIVLLLLGTASLYILLQNRKLNKAYKNLFEKNIKIIALQDKSQEGDLKKYKSSMLKDEMQDQLLDRILMLMNDTATICDSDFSLDKLAMLVHSNQTYVSQVINSAFKKNFRSFLNEYRIHEAQRLFSELDLTKYTLSSIAYRVGYKSPTTFRNAFKETTGVSPNFYFKSMQGGA